MENFRRFIDKDRFAYIFELLDIISTGNLKSISEIEYTANKFLKSKEDIIIDNLYKKVRIKEEVIRQQLDDNIKKTYEVQEMEKINNIINQYQNEDKSDLEIPSIIISDQLLNFYGIKDLDTEIYYEEILNNDNNDLRIFNFSASAEYIDRDDDNYLTPYHNPISYIILYNGLVAVVDVNNLDLDLLKDIFDFTTIINEKNIKLDIIDNKYLRLVYSKNEFKPVRFISEEKELFDQEIISDKDLNNFKFFIDEFIIFNRLDINQRKLRKKQKTKKKIKF